MACGIMVSYTFSILKYFPYFTCNECTPSNWYCFIRCQSNVIVLGKHCFSYVDAMLWYSCLCICTWLFDNLYLFMLLSRALKITGPSYVFVNRFLGGLSGLHGSRPSTNFYKWSSVVRVVTGSPWPWEQHLRLWPIWNMWCCLMSSY